MHINAKATPTNNTNYSCYIKTVVHTCITIHIVHVTSLVINSFEGGYTNRQTDRQIETHTHTHTHTNTNTNTHTHTHTQAHTNKHTQTHTHRHPCNDIFKKLGTHWPLASTHLV